MIRKIVDNVLYLFFPISCAGCGALLPPDDKYRVCAKCIGGMRFISEVLYCQICGEPLPSGGTTCWRCKKEKSYFEMSRSAVFYEGVARDLVHKFKYKGYEYLKHFFAKLLIELAKGIPEIFSCQWVIPVPLHRVKKILRGYNQAELLASVYCKSLKKNLLRDVLIRKKFTKQQSSLNREERFKNIEGAFILKSAEAIKGKDVLLIDDVQTTSATLNQCAKVLKRGGCKRVYCLTIAHD